MRPPRLLASMAVPALLCLASVAHAAWPYDPTVNLQLCNAGNEQRNPAAISDGAGGAIVVWEDQRLNANINIFAQRISAGGAPLWGNLAAGLAVCNATGTQQQPVICSDGSGGAIVAWADDRSGTWALYAQRISAAGSAQWAANGVSISSTLTAPSFGSLDYNIATDTQGGAYLAWTTSANEFRIQRVNGSGTALFAAGGVLLDNTHQFPNDVGIVPDGFGGAIACWSGFSGSYDILAQRVNASGTALWAFGGVGVCTDPGSQQGPLLASDGQGGAIFAWTDSRAVPPKAFAQHIGPGGAALWTGNGIPIESSTYNTTPLAMVGDGTGGAIVAFDQTDINASTTSLYAQRINDSGLVQWGSLGEQVVAPSQYQSNGELISDGAGGAVLAWMDRRNGSFDIYAQRLNPSGGFLWSFDDVAVCTQPAGQSLPEEDGMAPTLAPDGGGGAIVAWEDSRNDAGDIYAQRVERFGRLGNPEPVITKASDVLADQGGEVSLQWTASYLDVSPTFEIADYSIWREAPAAAAQAALRSGARLLGAGDPRPRDAAGAHLIRALPGASGTSYWEYLVSVPARALPGYSHVTPTTTDSTGTSNLLTSFMVMAEDNGGIPFWASAPDSGYSVDNLPPVAPAPFTGAYLAGATHLHWGANMEPDLAGYRLYRGTTSGFLPGPGNLISSQPDTGYADAGPAGSYYKLSAVDVHGNESAYSLLSPAATLDAVREAPHALTLAAPSPNPARGHTVMAFGLPTAGAVQLSVYDVDGRLVRTLVSGWLDAGQFSMPFDLRDDAGSALPGGLYFARLRGEGRTLVRRFAIAR
ncbi:MAG TPA: hypothetical protein VFI79_10015 [Gemmatimonadales bacterium]|nr:hypothetical protein [Gemmatimonadales bacterium]